MLVAVKQSGDAFQFAAPELKAERRFVLMMVKATAIWVSACGAKAQV